MENPAPSMEDSPQVPTDDSTSASEQAVPANRASSSSKHPPVAPSQSAPADDQSSSREMLATIAKFSEASIRDREEKVNLTLAACDSVGLS
jgi:hypothetical protein